MPNHFHLILQGKEDKDIPDFIRKICDGYTRYFNLKYNRKGPLWEGRFKNVLVKTDEQILHLTRYIHLNPVTAYLINDPEEWKYSSYNEFIGNAKNKICNFSEILPLLPNNYSQFVKNRLAYQRELSKIQKLILD